MRRICDIENKKFDGLRLCRAELCDYGKVFAFLDNCRNALEKTEYFYPYTQTELEAVLDKGYFLCALDGDEIVATCAVDTDEEYAKSAVDSATSDIDNKNENSSAYQSYKKDLQSAMQDRENARHDYEAYRQENERTHERRLRRAESAKKHAKYTWKSLGQVKNSATGVVTSVGGIASSGKKK